MDGQVEGCIVADYQQEGGVQGGGRETKVGTTLKTRVPAPSGGQEELDATGSPVRPATGEVYNLVLVQEGQEVDHLY